MSGLLDSQGRNLDTILTPQQNLALHQQSRQLIQTGLQQLGTHFQELFYKQALYIEYLGVKLGEAGIEIAPEAFAPWAEARHAQLQAEELAEQAAQAQELLALGTPVRLEE